MSRPELPVDEHGFPIPQGFSKQLGENQTDLLPQLPPPRGAGWVRSGWVRGGLLMLLLGTMVYFGFGRELKPWFAETMAEHHTRQAMEKWVHGDVPGALAEADSACYWAPDDMELLAMRGQFRLESGDTEAALDDFNTYVERNPRDGEGYTLRAYALVRLGRYAEAVADCSEALERLGPNDAEALNHRAYVRALGNIELEEGLADIERALEGRHQKKNAAFLDTRGYLHLLLGNLDEAQRDLDRAIALTYEQQARLGMRRDNFRWHIIQQNLAVMHHHRAELLEAQGNSAAAEREKELSLQLGYNPAKGVF